MFPRYHTDYRYGPYTIKGIRPNAEFWHTSVDGSWKYVTNGRGFRNTSDFEYDKPDGAIRIISLGDSHTQGYEVRQEFTFSAVLERYLGEHQKRAEVINAGVSGFSNAEELVFLENEGVKYQPEVVVVGFSTNDFEDNLKAGLFGLNGDRSLTESQSDYRKLCSIGFVPRGSSTSAANPCSIVFARTAEMHLPHGHHHTSELTHTVFRIEIGRRILATDEIASTR